MKFVDDDDDDDDENLTPNTNPNSGSSEEWTFGRVGQYQTSDCGKNRLQTGGDARIG